jgi:hypothetical protein
MNIQDWKTNAHTGIGPLVPETKIKHPFFILSVRKFNLCVRRYKIYIEGRGWSVSDKYILACDSMTLFVKPEYYDFFIRSMVPLQHYWPVSARNKCRDIKFAVEWGNNHTDKVLKMCLMFKFSLSTGF